MKDDGRCFQGSCFTSQWAAFWDQVAIRPAGDPEILASEFDARLGFRPARRRRTQIGQHRQIRGMGYLSRLGRPGHLDGASTLASSHGTHSFRVLVRA